MVFWLIEGKRFCLSRPMAHFFNKLWWFSAWVRVITTWPTKKRPPPTNTSFDYAQDARQATGAWYFTQLLRPTRKATIRTLPLRSVPNWVICPDKDYNPILPFFSRNVKTRPNGRPMSLQPKCKVSLRVFVDARRGLFLFQFAEPVSSWLNYHERLPQFSFRMFLQHSCQFLMNRILC